MSWSCSVELRRGSFEVQLELNEAAAVTALVGPNGSGKSSVLRAIAGLLRPTRGRICVGETPLFDSERGVDLPPEARRLGYLPQGLALFPHLDVLDNIAFGLATRGVRRRERRARAEAMLRELDLPHLVGRGVAGLSGGERQRIALARAWVVQPRLLLLDEPLAALDVGARRAARAYLADAIATAAIPTVIVTHDVRDVRALGADVLVLDGGRVVQRGSVAELAEAPVNAFVEEFLG